MKNKKITKNMGINKIINEYPDLIPLLMGYGLHCVGCAFSGQDTLEQGAKIHGMSDEDVGLLVNDCNELLEELEKDD